MRCRAALAVIVVVAAMMVGGTTHADAAPALSGRGPIPTVVTTVPRVAGVTFLVAGRSYTTNARGEVTMPLDPDIPLFEQVAAREAKLGPNVRGRFGRWYGRVLSKNVRATIGFRYRIRLAFTGPPGAELGDGAIGEVRLKSSTGQVLTLDRARVGRPLWLDGTRVVALGGGLETKDIEYSISSVDIRGANVVNRGEQRFAPRLHRTFRIRTLWYRVAFSSRDLLFGTPIGSSVVLTYPDGSQDTIAFGDNAEAVVEALPRGAYTVSVNGPGTSFERPVSLSKDQTVDLEMLSHLDVALVLGLLTSGALGLLYIGRGRAWRRRRAAANPAPKVAVEPEQP